MQRYLLGFACQCWWALEQRAVPHCHWHNLSKTENALAVWSGLCTAAFNYLQLSGCNEIMDCCIHWPIIITGGFEWQELLNSSWLTAPPELGHWQPAFTPLTPPSANPHACISEWTSFECTAPQDVLHTHTWKKVSQFEYIWKGELFKLLRRVETGVWIYNEYKTFHRIWEV